MNGPRITGIRILAVIGITYMLIMAYSRSNTDGMLVIYAAGVLWTAAIWINAESKHHEYKKNERREETRPAVKAPGDELQFFAAIIGIIAGVLGIVTFIESHLK